MKLTYQVRERHHSIEIECTADGIQVRVDDQRATIHTIRLETPQVSFLYNGRMVNAHVAVDGARRWVHWNGRTLVLERGQAHTGRSERGHSREGTGSGLVIAPMPGQVRGVLAKADDWVEAGQPLILLEAMKMEIRITAPASGQLKRLAVREGESVEREQVLGEVVGENK